MKQQWVPLALVGAGALLGVVGNWIKPPPRLGGGKVIALFVVILLTAGGLTFYNGRLDADEPGGPDPTGPAMTMPDPSGNALGPNGPKGSATATPTPSPSRGQRPSARPPAPTTARAAPTTAAPAPRPSSRPPTTSPYVPASRFSRFGGRHGPFTMSASGSQLRIVAPESVDNQWGGAIMDHHRCDLTIEFDVRLDAGTMDYYGFAVVPRGSINDDDQAQGGAVIFYEDSDGQFIAKYSSFPTPGIGGIGAGAYNVPDLRQTHRVRVSAHGGVHEVTVDGVPTGDYAESETECGVPMIAAWGGATAYVDRVLLRR